MDTEHRPSPKEEALRDLRRERSERRWRAALQAKKNGRHISRDYLLRLTRSGGVPDFAGSFAADRFSGNKTPPGRPAQPPLDPSDLDSLWYHFKPRPDAAAKFGLARLVPLEFVAVTDVRRRHAYYAAFETTQEPSHKNKPRLRYIASRGVWRVQNPKDEALRQVARRLGVKQATLEDWDRRVRAWEREVQIFRLRSRLGNLLHGYLRLRSSEKRSGS